MSSTNGYRLSVMIFAMAVCLTMPACRTSKEKACDANEVSASDDAVQDTISKLEETIIPEMTFYSPHTLADAIDFFNKASRDYAKPGTPPEQRGVRFVNSDPFYTSTNDASPRLAAISVRTISLFDAIQLVCEVTDMKLRILQNGAVMLVPKAWDAGEAVIRSYTIPQALADSLLNTPNGQPSDTDPNKVWKAFFEQFGVREPKWTEFNYLPTIGKLRVTSTFENLDVINAVFDQFALRMVEVEMQIHAFRTADIERLRLSGGMSMEALMALRQSGKGKAVASATALTKSGQETIVKAVREVNYPTELVTDVAQTGSNSTVRSAAQAVTPANFSMRETGMILQVIPEISEMDRSQIHVTTKPQWVTMEGWESYPADLASGWTQKTLSFKQPVFGVTTFETQVTVKDGGTLLLGSCSTPDGEWVNVGFVTARLKDVQPRYSGNRTEKAKAQDEHKDAEVVKKMREIMIPEATFRPPATIIDAIRFFKEASITYDNSAVPEAQRGLSFVLNLSANSGGRTENTEMLDPFGASVPVTNNVPVIPAMSARFISLYDILKLVCDVTGMKFKIRDHIVWVMPLDDPCENLYTRTYTLPFILSTGLHANMNGCLTNSYRSDLTAFFAQMGVNCPTGSAVTGHKLGSITFLRVTNTPENLSTFEKVLEDFTVCPRMVEVDVQIHTFPTEEIEQIRLSGDMSVEALMDLRKKGKSRQVASATVVTKSGQEAIVKAVREVIYPTELLTDLDQAKCHVTVQGGGQALVPGCFTTREVGMTLQITPEIASPDASQINVTLYPQWVTLEGWKSYPADRVSGWTHKTLSFKQPIFGTTSFEAQTLVEAGKTVLLGSSSTPDGKWVHVGFLTVK